MDNSNRKKEEFKMPEQKSRKLKSFLACQFKKKRLEKRLTQAQMAESLQIDPRSYADLEHGKFLCSTAVLTLYLLLHEDAPNMFLQAVKEVLIDEGVIDIA